MSVLPFAAQFAAIIEAAKDRETLRIALAEITRSLGFAHFALTHHGDIAKFVKEAIRLHNYPVGWVEYYDRNAFGVTDPVHRAAHVTSVGFRWSCIDKMIALTPADRRILALGVEQGIGDGFTVPANVPGEAMGSCSFAVAPGDPFPENLLPVAQLAGACAFEAARRLWIDRTYHADDPTLTDRQRDCVLWMARGKSDWEISRILGVSEETVVRHVKQARERYGVQKRTSLAIRTLFDGTLSFTDVLKR